MNFQYLLSQLSNKIALLTINRPQALNTLNSELLNELKLFLENIAKSKDCRALIITGAGEKSFVAGADINEMINFNREQAEGFSRKGQKVFSDLESLPFPVIAAINGFALGGGMELALACDIILISERAKIGLPELTLSLFPGFGGARRLEKAVGAHKAKEMIFSGNIYSAREAFEMGFGNKIVVHSELMLKAFEITEGIKQKSREALAKAKALMRLQDDRLALEERARKEAEEFGKLFDSPDAKEGMRAFLEKRKPRFSTED